MTFLFFVFHSKCLHSAQYHIYNMKEETEERKKARISHRSYVVIVPTVVLARCRLRFFRHFNIESM